MTEADATLKPAPVTNSLRLPSVVL